MSSIFVLKYFTFNYVLFFFVYIILNEKSFNEKFISLQQIYKNNKTKSENTMILCIQLIAHINLLACVPAHACISGNSLPRVSICKRYNHHLVLNYLDDLPWSNCSHSVGCFCPLLHWRVKEHFGYTDKIMFINWIICVKLRNLK